MLSRSAIPIHSGRLADGDLRSSDGDTEQDQEHGDADADRAARISSLV